MNRQQRRKMLKNKKYRKALKEAMAAGAAEAAKNFQTAETPVADDTEEE
jgi:hypothetical protein